MAKLLPHTSCLSSCPSNTTEPVLHTWNTITEPAPHTWCSLNPPPSSSPPLPLSPSFLPSSPFPLLPPPYPSHLLPPASPSPLSPPIFMLPRNMPLLALECYDIYMWHIQLTAYGTWQFIFCFVHFFHCLCQISVIVTCHFGHPYLDIRPRHGLDPATN